MLSYDSTLRSIGHGEICLGPVISVTLHTLEAACSGSALEE